MTRKIMEKRMTGKIRAMIFVVALTLAPALATSPAHAQEASFQVNGIATDYFACDNNNDCLFLILQGNSSGTSGAQQFFLLYALTTFNGTQFVTQDGFGLIPASAVSGASENTKQVTLNVDTSQVAGFTNSICFIDPTTFTGPCNNAPGGVVAVTWSKSGQVPSQSTSGTSTSTVAVNLQTTQNFQMNSSSATLTGSVLGFAVLPNGQADLGSGHSGQTVVQKP